METSSAAKVIVVTGSNKGIGYSIIRGLVMKASSSPHPLVLVIATREESRGKKAVEEAQKEVGSNKNVEIVFTQLDVCNEESIKKAADNIKAKFGGVDVLVNNAGTGTHGSFTLQVVKDTFAVNYYGLKSVTELMLPVLRPNGRIIHVSSIMGKSHILKSEELKRRFSSPTLTLKELDALVHEFENSVADGTIESKGWPKDAYGPSKTAVTAHAGVLSRSKELKEKNVMAFAICPGWCRTDLAGDQAPKSADQGAEMPVYLCLAPDSEVVHGNGKFWTEGSVADFW